ncbi:MAG: hypothetical protein MZV49_05325 [Rhodopseudomonas palustris]|nr:hypothetical protein [Rhodopseudomonas palustris]
MNDIKRYEAMGKLLQKYGNLLTFHQHRVMEQYYFYDLSLNEIAADLEISKSAVSEIVTISLAKLAEYEEKLKLLEADAQVLALLDQLALCALDERLPLIERIKEILTNGI